MMSKEEFIESVNQLFDLIKNKKATAFWDLFNHVVCNTYDEIGPDYTCWLYKFLFEKEDYSNLTFKGRKIPFETVDDLWNIVSKENPFYD